LSRVTSPLAGVVEVVLAEALVPSALNRCHRHVEGRCGGDHHGAGRHERALGRNADVPPCEALVDGGWRDGRV